MLMPASVDETMGEVTIDPSLSRGKTVPSCCAWDKRPSALLMILSHPASMLAVLGLTEPLRLLS